MISFYYQLTIFSYVLAVATEKDEESPIMIYIYDLRTLSLKYVFTEPNDDNVDAKDAETNEDTTKSDQRRLSHGRRRFVSVKFLLDNINIAALASNGDDCVLYYYSWRNSKVDTSLYIDGPVAEVSPRALVTLYGGEGGECPSDTYLP